MFIPKPHRGFAFVTVNDPNVTKRFCQIRDFLIRGKSVCVSIPTPKNNSQSQILQQQQQQQLQNADLYSNPYQLPQQASMPPYPTPLNYPNQYMQQQQQQQQQNWMNPRNSYRQSGTQMAFHEYGQWK